MDCRVIQGDIAAQSADVLVNAAGTSLRMGSGVAGSLRRTAGEEINAAAMEKGPVELGEVTVTDGFALDAEYVMHAAAMPHYGDGNATGESIRTATRNTLDAADALACESIVIPAIGCGVAGFDLREGAMTICQEIGRFEPSSLEDVRVIGYTRDEYETIRAVAASVIDGVDS